MTNKLRTQVYDVFIKPVNMDIESEKVRIFSDTEIGHVDPYGLKPTVKEDIEIKNKVEPSVIKQHINQEIEKNVISDKSPAPRRQCKNHK